VLSWPVRHFSGRVSPTAHPITQVFAFSALVAASVLFDAHTLGAFGLGGLAGLSLSGST
jgi:hypothetical protein